MRTSVQPSVESNRVIPFAALTLSRVLTSNGLQNNVLYLFLWQTALLSWCLYHVCLQWTSRLTHTIN